MNILIFLIILVILVLSHEFGHFIVAKKSDVRVDEFAFGFPPKIFGIKKGETAYNFNALPFGGYVKIFGENPDDASISGPESKRSFVNKPWYTKIAILIAGIVMNFLVAWVLLSIGFMSGLPSSASSMPKDLSIRDAYLTITSISVGSPAEKANLKIGDKITSIKTEKGEIKNVKPDDVISLVKQSGARNIEMEILRKDNIEKVNITPSLNKEGTPVIGISMDVIGKMRLPVHKAIWQGLKLSYEVTVATVKGFYNLIKDAILGKAQMSSLTGPVGIVGVVGDAREFGFIYLLSFTAFISINLAVLNLIPFPALDGGRILFVIIEKIKRSPIKPAIANSINVIGFGLLIILMVIVTYQDIVKLF